VAKSEVSAGMTSATGALLALTLAAMPVAASANDALREGPQWTRTLPAAAGSNAAPLPPILMPLADGSLLVRKGDGVIALAGNGTTRWSMPNVKEAILDGDAVVFRRSNVVFAIRNRDAGMLWKRPCADPPYMAVAGDRLVSMCAGLSTVLRARDGTVLAQHAVKLSTSPASLQGARPLNDGYVLVTNFFDGAWMGHAYYVVDAHTGAFLWSETDFDVVDVSPSTISITPYPSMLPWGNAGYVRTRRLADGSTVASQTYDVSVSSDPSRGHTAFTRSAAYVMTFDGAVFRFPRGREHDRQNPIQHNGEFLTTLGDAAFIFVRSARLEGTVFVDRPSRDGTYETRPIGQWAGFVTGQPPEFPQTTAGPAIAVTGGLAVAEAGSVRLYDASGSVQLDAHSSCTRSSPQVAATQTMVFVLCTPYGSPEKLMAFSR
jgi:PQQ-like domain